MDFTNNFNKLKVYIDVPFKEKDKAKKYYAKWDQDQKSWYFIYNIYHNYLENDIFNDSLCILTVFNIKKIYHKWYDEENNKEEMKKLYRYFRKSKKLSLKRLEEEHNSRKILKEEEEEEEEEYNF